MKDVRLGLNLTLNSLLISFAFLVNSRYFGVKTIGVQLTNWKLYIFLNYFWCKYEVKKALYTPLVDGAAVSVTSFVCLWSLDRATINKTVGFCIKRLLAYLIVHVILWRGLYTNKSIDVLLLNNNVI